MLRTSRRYTVAMICAAAAAVFDGPTSNQDLAAKEPPMHPYSRRIAAPEFPAGLSWINAPRPIELARLRGKFVLLDFWTLGCINCMHVIPELLRLEQAWPNELAVIGVHSAKFARERENQSIEEAVRRYGVEHPVLNDAEFTVWNRYGVQAWPTLALIDPEGYVVWVHGGEATFEQLDAELRRAAPYYRVRGTLRNQPLSFGHDPAKPEPAALHFPGKILADASGGRLFIADSGQNRIVVTRLDGSWLTTIGSGDAGRADGEFAAAQFNAPQGMALDGDSLYVADTRNHLIRRVDLAGRRVTTIAGTGRQNRGELPFGGRKKPLTTALSSPWDLWIHDAILYIAMAGVHQIWSMPLDGSSLGVYAGNGREDIVDGPLRPRRAYELGYASFAQPSGLASDGSWLFVADSEGSSIRAVPFDPKRKATTVVGTADLPSARLFTFGDVDGRGADVRLQHPLGVAFYDGKLYVADTYNNKIKTIDPATGDTQTLAGSAAPGQTDDPPAFNHPAGISAADGKLFIADTNNHRACVIDLRRGNRVSTLGITVPATREKADYSVSGK